VILATMATIIASQAVISGAFSVTQQAMQLGFIPRCASSTPALGGGADLHPGDQWALLVMVHRRWCSLPKLQQPHRGLRDRGDRGDVHRHLPASVLLLTIWKWRMWVALPLLALFFFVDIAYFAANLTKVPDGGWFPLLVGVACSPAHHLGQGPQADDPADERGGDAGAIFIKSAAGSAARVPGTAVFMTTTPDGIPTRCSTISSTTRCCTSG
jgi:KUP system potassium uptake protein